VWLPFGQVIGRIHERAHQVTVQGGGEVSGGADHVFVELPVDTENYRPVIIRHGNPWLGSYTAMAWAMAAAAGIACRVYPTASGMSGLLGQEDLQTALRARPA